MFCKIAYKIPELSHMLIAKSFNLDSSKIGLEQNILTLRVLHQNKF
jgi:hypothetical protein